MPTNDIPALTAKFLTTSPLFNKPTTGVLVGNPLSPNSDMLPLLKFLSN
jgi:hypothetical protein